MKDEPFVTPYEVVLMVLPSLSRIYEGLPETAPHQIQQWVRRGKVERMKLLGWRVKELP